jgi:uncharacterized protein (DUF697 family)
MWNWILCGVGTAVGGIVGGPFGAAAGYALGKTAGDAVDKDETIADSNVEDSSSLEVGSNSNEIGIDIFG